MPVDQKLLAVFVTDELNRIGVSDDADEIFGEIYMDHGEAAARDYVVVLNTSIEFANEHGGNFKLITEEDIQEFLNK